MGLGTLLVTLLASRPDFSRVNLKGHYLWMLMSETPELYLKASSCPFGWLLTGDHPLSWVLWVASSQRICLSVPCYWTFTSGEGLV